MENNFHIKCFLPAPHFEMEALNGSRKFTTKCAVLLSLINIIDILIKWFFLPYRSKTKLV